RLRGFLPAAWRVAGSYGRRCLELPGCRPGTGTRRRSMPVVAAVWSRLLPDHGHHAGSAAESHEQDPVAAAKFGIDPEQLDAECRTGEVAQLGDGDDQFVLRHPGCLDEALQVGVGHLVHQYALVVGPAKPGAPLQPVEDVQAGALEDPAQLMAVAAVV